MTHYTVNYKELETYCKDLFIGFGVPEADAQNVSESLVDADLRNVISHGVVRVGNYVSRIKGGGANPKPHIQVIKETGTTALLDGDNCLGAVVSELAVKMAREKAKANGIGYVAVRESNHYGAAARWAIKLSGDDMVGMTGSNVEPAICITGGKSKGLGNNPFSYAFPTGKYGALCYDVACSIMAGGKVLDYKMSNTQLPENCFLDVDGKPTTDPFKAALMLPFGGHKGYGLAVVVEMLSSILAGGSFGNEIGSQYGLLDRPNHISHYFMALDISAFRDLAEYKASTDQFIEYLHELPTAEGVKKIYVPGEVETVSKQKKLVDGIQLQPQLVEELIALGTEAKLSADRAAFLKKTAV